MINRAVLTGRLTKDVALRYTPQGTAVGNFTLAVDRPFTNKNGQRGTDFIRCVIWRKSAENFANFTHKGSLVGIDGRIQTGSYQNQQGETVYTTEIVIDNFALLESKGQSQPAPQGQQPMPNNQPQPQQSPQPRPQNNGPVQQNQNNRPQPRQQNPMAQRPSQRRNSTPRNPAPQKTSNNPKNNGKQGSSTKIDSDSLPF